PRRGAAAAAPEGGPRLAPRRDGGVRASGRRCRVRDSAGSVRAAARRAVCLGPTLAEARPVDGIALGAGARIPRKPRDARAPCERPPHRHGIRRPGGRGAASRQAPPQILETLVELRKSPARAVRAAILRSVFVDSWRLFL